MPHFAITGRLPLSGTVRASGSKNAALPMMAAALLAEEPLHLVRVPRLTDVRTMSRLLGRLGVDVARTGDGALDLTPVDPAPVLAPYRLLRQMRAGFCVLGPLLARRGRAVVSLPGGCHIGHRPVDLHLKGLAALGADLRLKRGYVVAEAKSLSEKGSDPLSQGGLTPFRIGSKRLQGARIELAGPRGPTVTGTANVLSAAVLARGETVITGAAREPEIVDLGRLLTRMGARIDGLGTSTLHIRGVDQLGGAAHEIIPDRIEAATLLIAAAITRGRATVTGVVPGQLTAVLDVLEAAGLHLDVGDGSVSLSAPRPLRPVQVTAEPYPGVPTDVQAQLTALCCLAPGTSTVRDTVFPERFLHVPELARLGAQIDRRGAGVEIEGVNHLTGAPVTASDLRASAALVLAALSARGTTTVHQIHHLDRGYERLDRKLAALGAGIERRRGFAPSVAGAYNVR